MDYESLTVCKVCHSKFTFLVEGTGRIFYACKCYDSHSRFMLFHGAWLVWDDKAPIIKNEVIVGKGCWRIATKIDYPPVVKKAFIFR
jgi:hypothetical protein